MKEVIYRDDAETLICKIVCGRDEKDDICDEQKASLNQCPAFWELCCVPSAPSAEADGEDLIIKGAQGIKDGLYNIQNGRLFKYKAKGGTVRSYPIVSAEAVQGEWIEVEVFPEVYDIEGVKTWGSEMQCDQCGFRLTAIEGHMAQYNFCPNCGAKMKGGDSE